MDEVKRHVNSKENSTDTNTGTGRSSCCEKIKKDLKLKDRIYKCETCGLMIDRDYNASINLANYGFV